VSWLLLLDASCVLVVAAVVVWRLRRAQPGRARAAGLAATAAFMVATIAFAAMGPLQSGWARRAGTPSSMLGSASVTRAHLSEAGVTHRATWATQAQPSRGAA
jgi:hypothetical protein